MATANMNLTLPTVGGSTDTWGTELNTALTAIDAHDHTSGNGVAVPSAGIGIDADLTFAGYDATNMGAVAFAGITAGSAPNSSIYENSADNEFYIKNSGGTAIQITNSGALDISVVGAITGDYTTTDADLEYTDSSKSYDLLQDESPDHFANVKCGNVILHEPTSGITNNITLKSPTSLAGSYDVELPAALPGSQSIMTINSLGAVAAGFQMGSGPSRKARLVCSSSDVISFETSETRTYPFATTNSENSGWTIPAFDGYAHVSTSSNIIAVWLEGIPVGWRIRSVDLHFEAAAADDSRATVYLYYWTDNNGTPTEVDSTQSADATGEQTVTIDLTSSPETIQAERRYAVLVNSDGAGTSQRRAYDFTVTYDFGA